MSQREYLLLLLKQYVKTIIAIHIFAYNNLPYKTVRRNMNNMKKQLLLLLAICLFNNLLAADLVLIKTPSYQDLKNLSLMDQVTLNYLGNGFVIATKNGELKEDFILLEENSWTKNHSYLLVFADEESNAIYRQEIGNTALILYHTKEFIIVKSADANLPEIVPPVDGSMVRIWKDEASLPSGFPGGAKAPLLPDPFIVARMAEVDTAIIHVNLQHLQDFGTRRCIKPEGVLAQNWIKLKFESYGLSTELFDFTMPQGSSSDNVIATKPGTLYPNEYVIIGGHYDSYTGGTVEPGADDNASGTCGVMEVARILSQYSFDRTIIFCAFSGEEYGLYGSEAYAAWCDAQNMNILGYMNMDMIGYLTPGDPVHTDIIAPASAQSLVDFYTGVVNLYLPAFITGPGALSGGDSDHTSFNNHGFMGIFPFEDSQSYSPYIHTSNDVIGPSVNNFTQVGIFTKAMVAATISLANMITPELVEVSGVVTDAGTGLPLANATVQVMNTSLLPVTTNSSGAYTISSVQEGARTFRVSKQGYATTLQQLMVSSVNNVFNFQLQQSTAWSFETGAFEPQWTFSGNLPWLITTELPYDGLFCSQSGAIADNQTSSMSIELYLTSAGTVSFFRKVSSEAGYDYLTFYIDNIQQGQWAGTLAWEEVSFNVNAGLHTFKWTYAKDANTIGGSDRAWVDYISFPPYSAIPDPPDIAVTPAQFTKTITLACATSDLMLLENLGEMPLNYTAEAIYSAGGGSPASVFPLNASYNTGSTTASAKTQTSLVKGYPTTEAGWMKFDISSIPDGATINSVEFHGYVNAANYPYWNINPVTNDPLTASTSVLYNDIIAESAAGYYLYRSEASTYSTGWKVHTLAGNVNANLQAALAQNWFAIGIMDRDNSASYYIGFDGWSQTNKPYLVVSYTYAPPYSWLTVNGLTTTSGTIQPAGNLQITAGFTAGTLAVGSYTGNIKVTSNDPDEATVLVPCTLNIVTGTTLNLTVLLEGLYTGASMRKAQDASGNHFPGNTADQVIVELHNAANYNNIVYSIANVDLSTTGTASVIIPEAFNAAYYITIRHRNSIETTTAAPVSMNGGTVYYNFTTAANKAYGSNMAGIGGVFMIYAGDNNQDGASDALDLIPVGNASAAGLTGYTVADLNGDGIVNNTDLMLLQNNASSFIRKRTP